MMMPDNWLAVYCRQRGTLKRLQKESTKLQACVTMVKYITSGHVERIQERLSLRKENHGMFLYFP